MSTLDYLVPLYQANRVRTLAQLDSIEQMPDPLSVLGWRPGPGRAHVAWQLMHIGVTEEMFATERLNPGKPPKWLDLWPRFRGGSTPDDDIPSPALIREVLNGSRERLLDTLAAYGDDRLEEIPPPLAQRGLTVRGVLHILSWHECHHHGQAHITLNLYKNRA